MSPDRGPRGGHGVTVLLLAVLLVVLGALSGPAGAQEPAPGAPDAFTTTTAPSIGPGLDSDGGSPRIFVLLSLLGGTTAVTIIAVQWFRTRPR